jgi:hypothetical protein
MNLVFAPFCVAPDCLFAFCLRRILRVVESIERGGSASCRSIMCSWTPLILTALSQWQRSSQFAGLMPSGRTSMIRPSRCLPRYYDGIPVDKKRDRRRLPYLLTERNADGGLVLQRRADGACAHLGAQGRTVYEHRPSACRSFDCRAFAAIGLAHDRDGSEQSSRAAGHRPGDVAGEDR